jgi:hypothetical protein
MWIYLSLLVAIAGLVTYALAKEKAMEIGRIMFWTGLLAFLLQSEQFVKLLTR